MGHRWYWDGWRGRGRLVFGVWSVLYWAAVAHINAAALVLSRRPVAGPTRLRVPAATSFLADPDQGTPHVHF